MRACEGAVAHGGHSGKHDSQMIGEHRMCCNGEHASYVAQTQRVTLHTK